MTAKQSQTTKTTLETTMIKGNFIEEIYDKNNPNKDYYIKNNIDKLNNDIKFIMCLNFLGYFYYYMQTLRG